MDKQDPKKVAHLLSKDLKEAAYVLPTWFATLPVGTPIEALRDPAYWANVAARLNVPGIIYAMPADGAFFAEFMVRAKGQNWAHVELLRSHEFVSAKTVVEKVAKSYDIKWGNPQTKFRVFRVKDNTVVKEGFATKESAEEWVAANAQAVTA